MGGGYRYGVGGLGSVGNGVGWVVVGDGRVSTMIPIEVGRTADMTWLEYHRLCEMLYAEQVHYYDD